LKNVFATIALMADKPCRVGELIHIDKYRGVVEDIGLRSTKLRLLNGHLVTIPNDLLAALEKGVRKKVSSQKRCQEPFRFC
jgi:MscS family membrane protein